MKRRAFIQTAAGLFVPAILGRAAVPMSVSDPAFLGRHRVTSAPSVPFAYEDFESYATGAITASDLTGYTGFAAHPVLYGSAVSIGQNSFADGLGKYLLISNMEYVQQLSVGSDWTTLRIGILWGTPETTDSNVNVNLMLGACSGTTHPWGQAPTTNAIGLNLVGRDMNGWQMIYSAGPPPTWYGQGGSGVFSKVSGTTTTRYQDASHGGIAGAGTVTSVRRVPHFFQITKGSPNFSVKVITPGSTLNQSDTPKATFATYAQASDADMSNVYGFFVASPASFPFSESNGSVDCIDLWWSDTSKQIYLYEIAAYKFA